MRTLRSNLLVDPLEPVYHALRVGENVIDSHLVVVVVVAAYRACFQARQQMGGLQR